MALISTRSYRRGIIYRKPGIIYRRLYEPNESGATALVQPARAGITLRIYDRSDILFAQVSSNAQQSQLLDLSWELLNTGCGQFDVSFSEDLGISHDFRLDVHLWNNPRPIYSGFVTNVPKPGSTSEIYSYSGSGGLVLLNRMTLTKTYTTQSVRGIVMDVLTAVVTQIPRLQLNPLLVEAISYTLVGDLKFLRTPIKTTLSQLADLGGGAEWGVDADRNVFFSRPPSDVDMHLWYGKHLTTYVPNEDSSEIVNTMYVKCGKVRDDLPTDSPYYKTNWLEDPIKDDNSISDWGVREGEYAAPNVLGLVDAAIAATVELNKKKVPRQYARVSGLQYSGELLTCRGSARIVGRGGNEMILPKKKMKFKLKDEQVMVDLELGDVDYTPASVVMRLAAVTAAESLARQQSQNQL